MSVTEEDVRNVSRLAKIRVDDTQISNIQESLNKILNFVDQLKEVDCSSIDDSIEYSTSMHERADIDMPCDKAVMNNAPSKDCNMFVVPKVIG